MHYFSDDDILQHRKQTIDVIFSIKLSVQHVVLSAMQLLQHCM